MEKKNIDWSSLGFGYHDTDKRFVANYKDGAWDEGALIDDPMITMSECAGVLQYAQTCFEGLKAYTAEDGHIVCFRPNLNAERMANTARRLEMPAFPEDKFVDAVVQTVLANEAYVPPYGSGASLYIRPYMFGIAPVIGVAPSKEYQFRVFTTPVGPYFKGGAFGVVKNVIAATFSTAFTIIMSIIFSLYLLTGKDRLVPQVKKVAKTYLKEPIYHKVNYVIHTLHECFRSFIVGQCVEAVILGSLCAIGMTILRLPYSGMTGALIGFTALIPIAGAYIGGGIGFLMIATVSPMKAIVFVIFLVILQQLEGQFIYPRVVGASIGLPGIWVLAAVTIGGSVLGIGGMLLFVPLTATVYKLLRNDVKKRNAGKKGKGQ